MAIHVFGAIDVGSYELGLKIFEISRKRGIREIDHLQRRVDLGSDTYETGKISYEHIREVGNVLSEYRRVMDGYQVEAYQAYGTSAIREMTNPSLVLSQWERTSGIRVDVISNSEQRFLDYKSIASRGEAFDRVISDTCAIVDVGGGSIQISLFDSQKLSATQNIPLGILRLYDQVSQINAKPSRMDRLIEEMVGAQLQTFDKLYLGRQEIHNIIVVDDYISAALRGEHQEYIHRDALDSMISRIMDRGMNQSGKDLGMNDDEVPLLYTSLIMMRTIMETFGADMLWSPGVELCDGIAYEYAEKNRILPPSHDFDEDIIACAMNISKRYNGSEERERTLESIALKIFAATKKIHGMGKREELLLRIATILHDCGKYISMSNLGECCYNIIMSTEIIGLSHIEREIVANVVMFNHEDFVYYEQQQEASDLDLDSYQVIAWLTAILRIANGLDRSHKKKFGDIQIAVRDAKMIITVRGGVDITLEKGMIRRRAEFFREVSGLTPVIKQKA